MSLVKGFTKKVIVWFAVFALLWLISSTSIEYIALALLAVPITDIIMSIAWHFMPKEMISEYDDKAVFITGCDSGFGRQLAQRLDKRGVTVYAGCLFPDGDGAAQLKNACSEKLKILHLDVTRNDHVQDAVNAITSTLGDKNAEDVPPESREGYSDTEGSGIEDEPLIRESLYYLGKDKYTNTNITNEKLVAKDLTNNWKKSPKIVHEDYGENYVDKYQKSMCFVMSLKRPENKVYEVVDALEHATIGKNPKIRYVPGLVGQIWTDVLRYAPVETFDIGCYFTTPRKMKTLTH
ncbi:hypothetical protein C0J52_04193 [Blattella germanica]|nr:hypothetical protein C0J52_04193 [Blattella germanica]